MKLWLHRIGYITTTIVAAQLALIAYLTLGGYIRQSITIAQASRQADEPYQLQRKHPSAVQYFPASFKKPILICSWEASVDPQAVVDDFENEWYHKHLSTAQEPSLYLMSRRRMPAEGGTVRFTWLRSFDPPVFVRVSGLGTSNPKLTVRELSGAGGYEPGTIAKSAELILTRKQADSLHQLIQKTALYNQDPINCDGGCDGSRWIIEGIDDEGYHFVSRWSPKGGPVREVGQAMLKLTGLLYKEVY